MIKNNNIKKEINRIVSNKLCTGCGACILFDQSNKSKMINNQFGPIPSFHNDAIFKTNPLDYCPGHIIDYDDLYKSVYGTYPDNWLIGNYENIYIGYSKDNQIRSNSSSGGILTHILVYLLRNQLIDQAIIVKQGIPLPYKASVMFAKNEETIKNSSQSVYTPVSMLDILKNLDSKKKYAITLLPDQAAVLRKLQKDDLFNSNCIKFVLGPYTGTQIDSRALNYFYKRNKINNLKDIKSIKWRAGEWPGYLEILTHSGKIVRSKKVYYNFLIPFYITNSSLLSIDFTNELADISVGDAWSPKYEKIGKGFSIITSRTQKMDILLKKMQEEDLIHLEKKDWESVSFMHGHMLDFKKRGTFIRIKIRKFFGLRSPKYTLKPVNLPLSRFFVEIINLLIFSICRTHLARQLLNFIPEPFIGHVFNRLRLKWKSLSKPTKRKGLKNYKMKNSYDD